MNVNNLINRMYHTVDSLLTHLAVETHNIGSDRHSIVCADMFTHYLCDLSRLHEFMHDCGYSHKHISEDKSIVKVWSDSDDIGGTVLLGITVTVEHCVITVPHTSAQKESALTLCTDLCSYLGKCMLRHDRLYPMLCVSPISKILYEGCVYELWREGDTSFIRKVNHSPSPVLQRVRITQSDEEELQSMLKHINIKHTLCLTCAFNTTLNVFFDDNDNYVISYSVKNEVYYDYSSDEFKQSIESLLISE